MMASASHLPCSLKTLHTEYSELLVPQFMADLVDEVKHRLHEFRNVEWSPRFDYMLFNPGHGVAGIAAREQRKRVYVGMMKQVGVDLAMDVASVEELCVWPSQL